jgi:hypothetical protein
VKLAAALLLAGCYTGSGAAAPPVVANQVVRKPDKQSLFAFGAEGLGPIHAGATVSLPELQAMFRGYAIAPEGTGSSFVFNVREGNELLFYVVPRDSTEPYGDVFGVHVKSRRITEQDHGWRVGDIFRDRDAIDHCECWGSGDAVVATCYRTGEHVAVLFERGQRGLSCTGEVEGNAVDGVVGHRIDRLVWQPNPWGK